jgi:hypothetical protein
MELTFMTTSGSRGVFACAPSERHSALELQFLNDFSILSANTGKQFSKRLDVSFESRVETTELTSRP